MWRLLPIFQTRPRNWSYGNSERTDLLVHGHLDWDDDIVDSTNRWEATLKVKDLLTVNGPLVAPDSATTDVTLRRLQRFSVPPGTQVQCQNMKNNVVVQQGSFMYQGGLVTIGSAKVYKVTSRLKVTYTVTSVESGGEQLTSYKLEQNYPNPFNPTTQINYDLPDAGIVSLVVYDVLGRKVADLANGYHEAGYHSATWNANDQASGVYFARFEVSSLEGKSVYTKINKIVLMK